MIRILIIFLLLLDTTYVVAQINVVDSTVQVIGYWDKGEKQTYSVSTEKYKVKNNDTTGRETVSYMVDVSITDSTAKSYTIDWFYREYHSSASSEMLKKISSLSENMHVVILTDEMGSFKEVVNWKAIRDLMSKSIDLLMNQYKSVPEMQKLTKQLKGMYSSKEEIENSVIKDIQQFYSFHGGKYKLHEELNGNIKVPNLYGGQPFDANVTLVLDSLHVEDDQAVIRMWQVVDKKQLTDAAYEFIKSMAKALNQEVPERNTFGDFENELSWATLVDGDTGWVVYSLETKEVKSDGILHYEERIIDIQ